ncbi:MAG: energy transducer TonB [Xanthomonadaceae bacterium]|nr:energy transducer TonB [Xanthomonadaceae bacterium]
MTPARTPRSEAEIMSLALVIAIVLHVLVITQLHFDWINPDTSSQAPDLDVILVDWASETAPEEADFLAQANQIGGAEASYMRGWVAKVERIGNMNYPEQARRQNIDGSLVLAVDVLPDGSIERIQLMRSSGYDLLDEAAIRIVRLAAPYSALPEEILAETDILTITRTWQFSARSGLN